MHERGRERDKVFGGFLVPRVKTASGNGRSLSGQ